MIHTIRTVAVGDQESKIDSPIILYRGDREVEVEFTINGSKFTFTNGGNVIKSTNATHGQLVINTPTGENMFSEVTECHNGKVVFIITKEMIDELVEVGFYSFQIRLFDESQVSRVTIPPVLKGIDIRNPIAAEDETNVVDIGLVDYAVVVKDEFEDLSTFLPDGNYNKTEWESKDVISGSKLNKIEDALYNINSNMGATDLALLNKIGNINNGIQRDFKTFKIDTNNRIDNNTRAQIQYVDKIAEDIDIRKANNSDVRMKSDELNLNDFDESTRLAILGMDVANVNTVLGEQNVTNDNIKRNTIQTDRVSFVNSLRQYINYSEIIMDEYYAPGSTSTVSSENACIYPPFRIYAGETYYYKDLYAYFTTAKYDNGNSVQISTLSDNYDGEFTAEDDGYLYCTLSKKHFDQNKRPMVTNSNTFPEDYIYGDYSVSIPHLELKDIKTGDTTFISASNQYIDYSTEENDRFYKITDSGTVQDYNNRDYHTCIYAPFRVYAGKTYHYKNLYAEYSFLEYDGGTVIAVKDITGQTYAGSFLAENNGYLYCTLDHKHYLEGLKPMVTDSSEFPKEYIIGEYDLKIDRLKLNVKPEDTTFIKKVEQYIDLGNREKENCYYDHNSGKVVEGGKQCFIVDPIKLEKGVTYYYNNIYGYFSVVKYDNGVIFPITKKTNIYVSGEFTAEDDGYFYVTVNTTSDVYAMDVSVSNSRNGLTSSKTGFVGNELIDNVVNNSNKSLNIITVKKSSDGDYTTLSDAIKSITGSSIDNQYEIHIYSGVYDMVEELGGNEWVASVSHSNGERQGLTLPDYTHLIGHGSVYIDCIVDDDVATADFAKSVSTINVYMNNRLEGITFRAKNTRYVIHDETNNKFNDLTRVIKNCRFIHYGNASSYWKNYKALGGGLGSGGRYDIINSHFESPFVPFSYHNNGNQNTNYINLDGCTFSGNESTYQYDVGFGYYKNNTEPIYVTVKNCISDRGIAVYQETSSVESDNVFELVEINNMLRK